MPRVASVASQLASLQQSPFAAQVLAEGLRVDRAAFSYPTAAAIEAVPLRSLSEAEFHALSCSFAISHLFGVLQQLAHSRAYLTEYRRTKALAAVGATRASDLVYHLEGFLVRTSMYRDRTLQLCSAVCHTGLAKSAVNYRTVSTNSIVVSEGIAPKLKGLEKLCSPYAQARNQVVHQHGLLNDEIRLVESSLLASRILPPSERGAAAASYRYLIKHLGERKGLEIEKFARSAIELSRDLFASLAPQYRRRQLQLRAEGA